MHEEIASAERHVFVAVGAVPWYSVALAAEGPRGREGNRAALTVRIEPACYYQRSEKGVPLYLQ